MPTCSNCNEDLLRSKYSTTQLRKDATIRKCKSCVKLITAAAPAAKNTQTQTKTKTKTAASVDKEAVNVKDVNVNVNVTTEAITDDPVSEPETASLTLLTTTNEEVEEPEMPTNNEEDEQQVEEAQTVHANIHINTAIGDNHTSSEDVAAVAVAVAEDDTNHVNETADVGIDTIDTDTIGIAAHDAIITQTHAIDTLDVDNTLTSPHDDPVRHVDNHVHVHVHALVISTSDETPVNSNTIIGEQVEIAVVENTVLVVEEPEQNDDEFILDEKLKEIQIQIIPEEVTIQNETDNCSTASTQAPSLIRIGICAMDKKARSKPMAEILSRLDKSLFAKISFGDDLILNSPIEEWPLCDVLIAFYSNGYPLHKVEQYTKLRKPFLLNDLNMQRVLKDRRRVYDLLEASGIDVPRHVFMNRDGYVSTNHSEGVNVNGSGFEDGEEAELMEHDDHIEVNGVVIHKPFVEKPVDADDHNIAIYYPSSAGGGCKKLFRKVGDRSSEFYPDINEIRREGSYIYEEFVETQGTDVKMYTVGPDYGHAEARKSPAVDGKVERNEDGKEVRFPVILTLREKEIARRIVIVFKQYVCGFDLLRVQEGDSLVSYVCDVNGWSFVKNSRKYYDDCAQILTEHMLAAVKPKALHGFSALDPLMKICRDTSVPTPRRNRRAKAFVRAVSGQTDSCPPSPVKESEREPDNMENHTSRARAATLEEGALPVRDMPDMLINIPAMRSATNSVNGDDDTQISVTSTEQKASTSGTHQEELRCVIAVIRHGDRTPKQKLKVNMSEPLLLDYFHKHSKNCKKDLKIKAKKPMTEFLRCVLDMIAQKEHTTGGIRNPEARKILYKLRHMRDVLERWKIGGLNRKLQLKPRKWDEFLDADGKKFFRCAEVQLILKWGGNLTKLGEKQAISLGERFRNVMYPKTPGGGILRLHSTFRHDMKIKTSDEGRVMKTAAAFAKGFLELEGSIPPILVSLVHKEKDSLHMLDPSGNKEVKAELEACKFEVNRHLQRDLDVNSATKEEIEAAVGPQELTSITGALRKVQNPRKALFQIRATIGELLEQLDDMLDVMASDVENKHEGGEGLLGEDDDDEALSGIKLYKGETLLELTERWRLLHTKLYDEDIDEFDLSRVPDVHDNVRFDMLHNPHIGLTSTLRKLYTLAKVMADCVVPQEYGTAIDEKRSIGNKMCHALLDKIKYDLIIARTDNQVDMRYMINLDYSADLPINTMGRRVRTRLYFTSESHLHTLLNVLRFPSKSSGGKKSPLSRHGLNIISTAPELCYLTQVVIRLFENTNKEPSDPKRFRIEILFSPGATATPLHMSQLKRDEDTSRFDTEPLQRVSSDYLTCQEVEDYFSESIREGQTIEEEEDDSLSVAVNCVESKKVEEVKDTPTETAAEDVEEAANDPEQVDEAPVIETTKRSVIFAEEKNLEIEPEETTKRSVVIAEEKNLEIEPEAHCRPVEENEPEETTKRSVVIAEEKNLEIEPEAHCKPVEEKESQIDETADMTELSVPSMTAEVREDDDSEEGKEEEQTKLIEKGSVNAMAKILSKQFFWTSIASISFVFGIGLLVVSREVVEKDFKTRRWSRR